MKDLHTIKMALDALVDDQSMDASILHDPIFFVRQYTTPVSQEIVGIVASCLAFGRVQLFMPILQKIFAIMDKHGGPEQFIRNYSSVLETEFQGLVYRWHKEPDFSLLFYTLQHTLQTHDTIQALFQSNYLETDTDMRACLGKSISVFREHAVLCAPKMQLFATKFTDLPDSFRRFFSSPVDKSACKRWHMFLRWMIRKNSPDIGIWQFPSSKLCIILDTHVHSIATMIGLTKKNTLQDATVSEITHQLQQICPEDPIRYDFALAHLGIDGRCVKSFQREICGNCQLRNICIHSI
jgi:uncharacterized protein (TIGR02757 family)